MHKLAYLIDGEEYIWSCDCKILNYSNCTSIDYIINEFVCDIISRLNST